MRLLIHATHPGMAICHFSANGLIPLEGHTAPADGVGTEFLKRATKLSQLPMAFL